MRAAMQFSEVQHGGLLDCITTGGIVRLFSQVKKPKQFKYLMTEAEECRELQNAATQMQPAASQDEAQFRAEQHLQVTSKHSQQTSSL